MKTLQKKLLLWYHRHHRKELPWRKTRDPYSIWVSETMLQQTQVVKVIPYYERFLNQFPTVKELADAPLTAVLDSWAGLGYYSRAKNLHAASKRIVEEHEGRLPTHVDQLLELPGVGRYTAGAIASIAYDRPAPILDGNVIRVLCRILGIQDNPRKGVVRRKLWRHAERLVPTNAPGTFNQALMELGALVCTPRQPHCPECPLTLECRAYRLGLQEEIPLPQSAPSRKKIFYVCALLQKGNCFLIARRPLTGLLPGLWEFPGGEKKQDASDVESLRWLLKERFEVTVNPSRCCADIRQILSHRQLHIKAFACSWKGRLSQKPRWYLENRWVPRADFGKIPFTAGMRTVAEKALWMFLFVTVVAGCTTTVPKVSSGELKFAQELYEVKAQRHIYHQILRVRTVGERLLEVVPEERRSTNRKPSVGLIVDELTLTSGRVFGVPGISEDEVRANPWLKQKKACLIAGVLPKSPAARAGIKEGDLLLQVDNRPVATFSQASAAFRRLKPHTPVLFLFEREGVPFKRIVTPDEKPYPVSFGIVDDESVNAYSAPGQIVVTTGLLRFIQSDDELAVVLAHELAHLTQGHIAKAMGPGLIVGTISAIAGTAIDIVLPGGGDAITQATRAPFSQDFEREADYVGLKYAYAAGYKVEAGIVFWDRFATELPRSLSQSFFSTHPTSPERLLRLQKTIEELKKGEARS